MFFDELVFLLDCLIILRQDALRQSILNVAEQAAVVFRNGLRIVNIQCTIRPQEFYDLCAPLVRGSRIDFAVVLRDEHHHHSTPGDFSVAVAAACRLDDSLQRR